VEAARRVGKRIHRIHCPRVATRHDHGGDGRWASRSDLWPHSTAAPPGEPYAPGVLSRYWRETLQAAGIRHIKLHAARHTCVTLMHLQGVPAAVIAACIGHKDASLTMKLYAIRTGQRGADDGVEDGNRTRVFSLGSRFGGFLPCNSLGA
jgi:integrase